MFPAVAPSVSVSLCLCLCSVLRYTMSLYSICQRRLDCWVFQVAAACLRRRVTKCSAELTADRWNGRESEPASFRTFD